MKRSEYKKEINRLVKLYQELDDRLEVQWKTSIWLNKMSTDLSNRTDKINIEEDYHQREKLIGEANEILGRIQFEKNLSKNDKELENKLSQELNTLISIVIKEGIEE